jgi:hypothetical protein
MAGKLNEIQLRTRENDLYKNGLVASSNWTLIRIWEDEIDQIKYETI